MTVHLIKLSVGSESVDTLAAFQARRLREIGVVRHVTRFAPKRAEEVLDGGSIYWVIRRAIRARQRILRFEDILSEDGITRCAIILDPQLVRTARVPFRAFQGWRYFRVEDAPPDAIRRGDADTDDLPTHLAEELRDLGLL